MCSPIDRRGGWAYHEHMNNDTTCTACQVDAKRAAGEPITQQERNAWMMWGCTCTTEAAQDAMAWMALVTR